MSVEFVLYSLATSVCYFCTNWIYGILSKQKFKLNLPIIILIFLMGTLNTYINMHFSVSIKIVYNLICYCTLTKLIYKDDIKTWLFYSLLIWSAGSMLDMLFMSAISALLFFVLDSMPTIAIPFITLLLQVVYNFLFRIKFVQNWINKLKEKIEKIPNIGWIYFIVIILLVLFSTLAFNNMKNLTNEIMILFLVLIAISISVHLIHSIYSEKIYNEALKNLLNNNLYYVDLNSKNRIFKHNIIHKLDGVKTVANDKVKKLVNDIIKEYNLSSLPNKEIDNLPNGINGLICQKIYSNKSKKLNFAINNYLKSDLFEILTPKNYNKLCETLGICLDNAINASLKTKDKVLQIVILENDDNIFIKIINTFKSEIEIDNLGKLNYTTKREGQGLGLYSIFMKKGVKIKTSIINNLFENQLIIKKRKVKA